MKYARLVAAIALLLLPAINAYATDSRLSQRIDGLYCPLTSTSNGSGTVVSPGCEPQAPIVGSAIPNNGYPTVEGLFDAAFGPNFRVGLGGKWYVNGTSAELSTSGNVWTLDLQMSSDRLLPGKYEVRAEHTLSTSAVLADTTSDELVIPIIPIVAPTIKPMTSTDGLPILSGTYDANESQRLRVRIDTVWYELGVDSELSATGNTWKLDLSKIFPPLSLGRYDVDVEVVASDGRTVVDTSTGELVVQAPPTPVVLRESSDNASDDSIASPKPVLSRAPTVDETIWVGSNPVVEGTYDSGRTVELRVYLAGRWYLFGVDVQLKVDGDKWQLDLRKNTSVIPIGVYDVAVQTKFNDEMILADLTKDELTILPVSFANIVLHPFSNTEYTTLGAISAGAIIASAGTVVLLSQVTKRTRAGR